MPRKHANTTIRGKVRKLPSTQVRERASYADSDAGEEGCLKEAQMAGDSDRGHLNLERTSSVSSFDTTQPVSFVAKLLSQKVPLYIAAPAAFAALSYLNAKWQVGSDLVFVKTLLSVLLRQRSLEKADRANVFYMLEEHAEHKDTSTRNFLWFEGKTWTYKETYDIVLRYAAWYKSVHQIAPGEIVAIDSMNHPRFVFATFALYSLGAKPAYINYNLSGQPLLHCIKSSKARLCLFDDAIADRFNPEVRDALASPTFRQEGKGPVEAVEFNSALEDHIASLKPHREPDAARSGAGFSEGFDKMAMLIFTSGTTGLPKPAVVSWAKLQACGLMMTKWGGLKKEDIYYTCMPLYHSTATILALFPCLYIGATCAIGHKFSNSTFWPEVRASKATIIQYVGETCRYLLTAPPQRDPITGADLDKEHNVHLAFGNGMRPDVWNRFKDRFGIETIGEFYSATESPHSSWNLSRNSFTAGAIGRAGKLALSVFGRRLAVVKVDTDTEEPARDPANGNYCIRCETGEPGELLVRLDPADIAYNYQGYYGNESASEKKILRDVFEDGDAFFRSGDIVMLDEEGRQFFVDRIGDTFRWRSENVSTNEVSGALGLHPAISEANVYGVQLPHHDGRAGCAAVTFNDNVRVDSELMKGLAAWAVSKLPKYAVPIFIRVTKDQMVTGNNKQQKHIFRSQGVDLKKIPKADVMYWLNGGSYEPFTKSDWDRLKAGGVKL